MFDKSTVAAIRGARRKRRIGDADPLVATTWNTKPGRFQPCMLLRKPTPSGTKGKVFTHIWANSPEPRLTIRVQVDPIVQV
jgi:hypothetical protein